MTAYNIQENYTSVPYPYHFQAAIIIINLLFLHQTGSNNPIGLNRNIDKFPFHSIKDTVGFIILIMILTILTLKEPYILSSLAKNRRKDYGILANLFYNIWKQETNRWLLKTFKRIISVYLIRTIFGTASLSLAK